MDFEPCTTCALRPAFCHGHAGLGITGCAALDHNLCEKFEWTCVCNPERMMDRFHEVGGFECELRTTLIPTPMVPHYVPTIYHGYRRAQPLDFPWVAVPIHRLFTSTRSGKLTPAVRTAEELRIFLNVVASAKIAVTGVGPDQSIEDFWGVHRSDSLLSLLAQMKVNLFTAPNFSFPSDSPPLHHRYNRSRILRMTERASRAGLPVVLHLYSIEDAEWRDYEDLLKSHPEIEMLCMEFQTGYAIKTVGNRAFTQLVDLQQRLGRKIHPIFIGGARYAASLGKEFAASTVIDAQPFMHTFTRKLCTIIQEGQLHWKKSESGPDEDMHPRLRVNVDSYNRRLAELMFRGGQRSNVGIRNLNVPLGPTTIQKAPEEMELFVHAQKSAPPTPRQ